MNRKMLWLLEMAIAAGALFGAATALASAPVTVTVWSWRSQDTPMWAKVQSALNTEGKNIKINYRSILPTSYNSVVQTAFDNGHGPDLFYGRAGEGTFDYAAAGFIRSVDTFANFKNLVPASLAAVYWKGKDWGVPLDEEVMAVFYNKRIFTKYQLTPPTTWSQFMQINKSLKSHGVTPIYVMPIQSWMVALEIETVEATALGNENAQDIVNRKTTFDSPSYIHVLSLFKSLTPYFEPNFMAVGSNESAQQIGFATRQAAMTIDGGFNIPAMVKYGLQRSDIGVFLIPPDQQGLRAQAEWYPDADLAMNAHISNAAVERAAKTIIQYTTTKAFGQNFADIAGEISPIKGVVIPSKYPLARQLYTWFQQVPINPLVGIRSPMDTPPPSPVNQKSVNTDVGIFSAEINVAQPLLSGKLTPEQAAAKIQKAVSWYFK